MAEIAVSFALEQLYPLLKEEANLLRGIHKQVADIKDELEFIQAFLKDADSRAEADLGDPADHGVQTWVKHLRAVAFRIEDLIDEYKYRVAQRPQSHRRRSCGFVRSLQKVAHLITSVKPRHEIASEIQGIKESVREINERSKRYGFERGSTNKNVKWHDPRMASLFIEEAQVVGFEAPKDELTSWLVEGATERTVISVVGMGGLGKTTLASTVLKNQVVTRHFDCRAFITVSQIYTIEELLRSMMKEFCKLTKESLPQNIHTMDQKSLITMLRHHLLQKRYVVFFDDVWEVGFWEGIELALPDNGKGSRIIITTRIMGVAEFCKKSALVHVHKMQGLPHNKAWELFCKKAFGFGFGGVCPAELEDISNEIVKRCQGLPLAIVAIGGLLSTKEKILTEWQKLHRNLGFELESNPHLTSLTRILALSYEDLPYHLKSCFLYFGIYPEDYFINCVRLIRQWVAEGFVKFEKGKSLEEVAEQYLTELIHRSMVQVSELNFDGKARRCQVHDMVREIILRKMEGLSFCHFASYDENDDQSTSCGFITRRLVITTSSNNVWGSIGNSCSATRSMYFFQVSEFPVLFLTTFCSDLKLLKVLDFEDSPLDHVPDDLGNLFHLRYLSLRNTNVKRLPISIGKLQNLETLDLKQTQVYEIPTEITQLQKLRHLLAYYRNYNIEFCLTWERGVKIANNIGCLMSLQKLYHVEANHDGVDLIKELGKLRQLRKLGVKHLTRVNGKALCASIDKMNCLESLDISSITEDEIIDLQSVNILSLPPLRRLHLKGRLEKLPNWIPQLHNLLGLTLDAYDGEQLHFEEGGFLKLNQLKLRDLKRLNSVIIDKGALPALQELELGPFPQMKEVPPGIQHLKKLDVLEFYDMPREFEKSIDPDEGPQHWIIQHVPTVRIGRKLSPEYGDYHTSIIHHPPS
ncbi:Disease resistance protein [Quillaja saponaria]|uniref:Disease resistance protein n=1 Tax=Quillaja saponaria TaxID=32244 RepID=A0AAD7PQW8_QUISA|nr:Disease resistance protein [Quillaja saponaria]